MKSEKGFCTSSKELVHDLFFLGPGLLDIWQKVDRDISNHADNSEVSKSGVILPFANQWSNIFSLCTVRMRVWRNDNIHQQEPSDNGCAERKNHKRVV